VVLTSTFLLVWSGSLGQPAPNKVVAARRPARWPFRSRRRSLRRRC